MTTLPKFIGLAAILCGCPVTTPDEGISNVDPSQCEPPGEEVVSCDQRTQGDLTGLASCVEFRVVDLGFLTQLEFDCQQVAGTWAEEPCPVDDTLFGHCLTAGDSVRVVAQYCYGDPEEVAEECRDICTLDEQGWCSGPGENAYQGGCPIPSDDVGACLYQGPRSDDLPDVTSCWEIWGFEPSTDQATTAPPNYREDLKSSCESDGHQWLDTPCPRPEDTLGQCTYEATAVAPPNTWVFAGEGAFDDLPCGGTWCNSPLDDSI